MASEALRIFLLVGLASCLAWGEGAAAAGKPDASATQEAASAMADMAATTAIAAAARTPDLDFGDDFPSVSTPNLPPRGDASRPGLAPAPPATASRAWIYWTVGLTAVAGGAAWLAHDALDGADAPKRSTEEFTDAAP